MKKTEISILAGFLVAVIFCSISAFASDCDRVRRDVLRLHILANSDDRRDQQLKLSVRDAVLKASPQLFDPAASADEAAQSARAHLDDFRRIAEQTLRAQGCQDTVRVRLCKSYFETRTYDDLTLPAGVYNALRIEIGKGAGHNWWCVLFPALCIPAAQDSAREVFTPREKQVVTAPKYQAKFALVEFWEGLKNRS